MIIERQKHLMEVINTKKVQVSRSHFDVTHLEAALAALDGDVAQLAAGFDADPADLPPAVRAHDCALLIYDKFTTSFLHWQWFSRPFPKNNT